MDCTLPQNDLLLRAARRERTERTPVWFMRQAGRSDPEYVKLREKCGLALHDLFRHVELATEISLLPARIGVDAIIMFQDILTPLSPMGAHFEFHPGPVLRNPIRTKSQIKALRLYEPEEELPFVGRTLQQLERAIGDELPILGFAGAPLTLAFFLIEGKSPGNRATASRGLMRKQPALLHELLGKLADMTIRYLNYQIENGAHAVQLFESMADLLTPAEYQEFAHPYHVRIFDELGSSVPRILFAKEQPDLNLMVQSGADVLSVGTCVDLESAARTQGQHVAFQGNLDNRLLVGGTTREIQQAVRSCIAAGNHQGHILNLSHGLLRETPFENVQLVVDICRETRLALTA
ncbi:MAG: uroporphyrinogen decarboxylase [Planctomycetes bacterium]|nr:uroporphyrinogen decarboxylase [Planctomycetota bacterium]